MRAVVQRVLSASVTVDGQTVSDIGPGLLVFLGVGKHETEEKMRWLAEKVAHLRIFEDAAGKMNDSLLDTSKAILVVSQFTLFADCQKGRRPSFVDACEPHEAEQWYKRFCEACRALGLSVQEGVFRADMKVALVNDGPVTLWLDTDA